MLKVVFAITGGCTVMDKVSRFASLVALCLSCGTRFVQSYLFRVSAQYWQVLQIRFLQNSIDFYRFSWILIDFHVFRGVDAKVIHEKRETGENLTFKQSKYVKKISFQFCRIELPCK